MANPPIDSEHLTDIARSEMVAEYGGAVDVQIAKESTMAQFFPVMPIIGTDTKFVRRMGRTRVQKLTPGVRPGTNVAKFGRASVTVDTTIIARNMYSQLSELQTDFGVLQMLGTDHGKEHGKKFDEAFFIQGIKAAGMPADSVVDSIGSGRLETLAGVGDELDPDLLYERIAKIIVEMEEDEHDVMEHAVFVRPTIYEVLLNNDKLIDRDFSQDNGDFATGKLKTIKNVPLVKAPRLPKAAIAQHELSTAENGMAYDLSATEAKVVALIMNPMSLLAGETMPLTSNIWFDEHTKDWVVDTWRAFGVAPRRQDMVGVVRKA